MLTQWLLTMVLTAEITLASMQGFLMLTKMHLAQIALVEEQEKIRFLVGYFRAMLHRDNVWISVGNQKDSVLEINQEVKHQFFLQQSEKKTGLSLFVQEGDHRREALSSGLEFFSLKFCTLKNAVMDCKPADSIQDWPEVSGIEFNVQFQSNTPLDNILRRNNRHRWQFFLKKGESGHALIVVMVFLMMSNVLLLSALELLKQNAHSTRGFELSINSFTVEDFASPN